MKEFKIIGLSVIIAVLIATVGILIGFAVRSVFFDEEVKNPIVTLDIDGYGEVKMELYPEYAPNTVNAIIKLVQNKYYDGKVFYGTDGSFLYAGMIKNEEYDETEAANSEEYTVQRVIEDTPTVSDLDSSVASGSKKDYKISLIGEFVANGYEKNTLRFEEKTIGLYRRSYVSYNPDDTDRLNELSYNSGDSLFFISMEEKSSRNGLYAPFGKVIEGYEILEEINKLKINQAENSEEAQMGFFEEFPIIKTATVETFGVYYEMPVYTEAFDYDSYFSNALLQYYQNQ